MFRLNDYFYSNLERIEEEERRRVWSGRWWRGGVRRGEKMGLNSLGWMGLPRQRQHLPAEEKKMEESRDSSHPGWLGLLRCPVPLFAAIPAHLTLIWTETGVLPP
ncbi:hypothetical protein L596_009494 [Steinernema carpocapsae]|uniref:Uncharacterized protein n=1 Tax=Steinernema carpocapsae TaxID=34508 RepID=A0A4U5PG07_STECR|nr:hypothetical protein L596_009494 [Steinernema carpocapsae]